MKHSVIGSLPCFYSFIIPSLSFSQPEKRKVVSLNGQWDIAVTRLNEQKPPNICF